MTSVSPALALAARLADPMSRDILAPTIATDALATSEDAAAFAALLRRNRVSLLPAKALRPPQMQVLLETEPFAIYVQEEERAYAQVRQEYGTIRAAFAAAGLVDVLIKSAGMAPSFPHLSDNVDDLVPADGVATARAALRALGYVELRNLEEPRKFFFKRFSGGQQVAAHHLHEHVGWAVSFLDEQLLLRRVRPAADDNELLIPHPEDAFLITTAHALYENKAFKLGDLVKVRHCLRSGQLDWPRMRDLTAAKGWLDGLDVLIAAFSRLDAAIYGDTLFPADVVRQAAQGLSGAHRTYVDDLFSGELAMPLRVSFGFSKRLFYAKCWHDRGRSTRGRVYDIVRHTLNGAKLKLRIHSQPGMLVTLSGVDGSGKTQHARALENAFELCDIRAHYVWSRSGSSRLTDAFVGLAKSVLRRPPSAPGSTQEQRASGRREMARSPLVRQVWTALVCLDLIWQYAGRVGLPLLRGRVVICDRYTYDAIADLAAMSGRAGGFWPRLLIALSPKPALRYLISVPAVVVAARRQDEQLSEDSISQQAAVYAALARQYGLAIVNNALPFAEANDPLVRQAIRTFFARYRTLINGVFMANPEASSQ